MSRITHFPNGAFDLIEYVRPSTIHFYTHYATVIEYGPCIPPLISHGYYWYAKPTH